MAYRFNIIFVENKYLGELDVPKVGDLWDISTYIQVQNEHLFGVINKVRSM